MQRQQIHLLLVYSKQGLDLFSKIFRSDMSPSDVTLLTGGFSAITSLFQEMTKSSGEMQTILFENKELRLLKRKDFIVAILEEYATQASQLALEKFADEFENEYGDALEEFSGNVSQFQSAVSIANKYFS